MLLVLVAFCRLASRESGAATAGGGGAGAGGGAGVLHQGKLLALEMLGRVLGNPQHSWAHVSEAFCRHLRQPLCLALLRNCAAADPQAYALAVRLLSAILALPRLRLGLRAELGAFLPLLVLRPLEQEPAGGGGAGGGSAAVLAALAALRAALADPQLAVDLFVNYDCDLQASNLFERSIAALSRLSRAPAAPEGGAGGASGGGDKARAEAAARADAVRREARAALLAALSSVDQWAAPIRDAALRAAAEAEAAVEADDGAGGSASALRGAGGSSGSLVAAAAASASAAAAAAAAAGAGSDAERFTAAKTAKDALARAIAAFNGASSPSKGVDALVAAGVVEAKPEAVRRACCCIDSCVDAVHCTLPLLLQNRPLPGLTTPRLSQHIHPPCLPPCKRGSTHRSPPSCAATPTRSTRPRSASCSATTRTSPSRRCTPGSTPSATPASRSTPRCARCSRSSGCRARRRRSTASWRSSPRCGRPPRGGRRSGGFFFGWGTWRAVGWRRRALHCHSHGPAHFFY